MPFKAIRTELCCAGKLLLRGTRIILPEALRQRAIQLAHEGHMGILKMKQRLRSKLWWPGMDADVEKYVKLCHPCELLQRDTPPEPVKRSVLPEKHGSCFQWICVVHSHVELIFLWSLTIFHAGLKSNY